MKQNTVFTHCDHSLLFFHKANNDQPQQITVFYVKLLKEYQETITYLTFRYYYLQEICKTSPNLIKTNQMQQKILFFYSTSITIWAGLGSWKKYSKFPIDNTLVF